jgi:uncharacterized membrane protein
MSKGRLEAFSDGVLAIIITIMVLELKASHDPSPDALRPLVPKFLSYLLSFIYVAIYWNNHHHMLQAARLVNGAILWANMHLLFWLSLIPFTTAWMGETHFAHVPVAVYGVVLLLAGIAYYILAQLLIAHHGRESVLARAFGRDRKGQVSVLLYAVAIPFAFVAPWVSGLLYVAVAIIWLIPDRRIEATLTEPEA